MGEGGIQGEQLDYCSSAMRNDGVVVGSGGGWQLRPWRKEDEFRICFTDLMVGWIWDVRERK